MKKNTKKTVTPPPAKSKATKKCIAAKVGCKSCGCPTCFELLTAI